MNMDILDELSFATGLPFAISRIRPFNGSPVWEAMTMSAPVQKCAAVSGRKVSRLRV